MTFSIVYLLAIIAVMLMAVVVLLMAAPGPKRDSKRR